MVLLVLILGLMIGCSDNKNLGNEYIEGKDAQYMFMGSQDQNYIAMAENGYYFLNGIYIFIIVILTQWNLWFYVINLIVFMIKS